MSVYPSALGVRARFIVTVAAVLVASTVVVTARAEAAGGSGSPVLAQGAGMAAKPSAGVRQVQRALERRGYDLGDAGIDGRFGPVTAAAVRRLQAQRGLAVDGVVGTRTRAALRLSPRAASAPSGRSLAERSAAPRSTRTPKASATHGSTATRASAPRPTQRIVAFRPGAPGRRDNRRRERQRCRAMRSPRPWCGPPSRPSRRSPWPGCGVWCPGCAACAPRRRARVWPGGRWTGAADGFDPPPVGPREPVIGYVTTATDEWSETDEASAAAIEATCEQSEWSLFYRPRPPERKDPRPAGTETRAGADRRGAGPRPGGQRPAASEPLAA